MTFSVFNDLSSEVIVCFVDIGGIVDHRYLSFLFMMLLCHQSICVSRKPVTSNSSWLGTCTKMWQHLTSKWYSNPPYKERTDPDTTVNYVPHWS
jgi:hypothetical protein